MFPSQAIYDGGYLFAGVLFMLSLGGLSSQETARRGNLLGIIGMIVAIAMTALALPPPLDAPSVPALTGPPLDPSFLRQWPAAVAMVLGGLVGAAMAARVAMTSMPQLIALLHSFVGLAAVLVGFSTVLGHGDHASISVFRFEVWLEVVIGAITFTGSVLAWAKLRGSIGGQPLLLPGRHLINLAMLAGLVGALVGILSGTAVVPLLIGVAVLGGLLGVHLVAAIGGADMPVVVSLLNSYSGWAAAAAGFLLGNDALIITGALVGSSGAILSKIMCDAMNRSIWSVVFGGFGTADTGPIALADGDQGEVTPIDLDTLADRIDAAQSIVIVPGYGMAVAQAQAAVFAFTRDLRARGKNVRFAIHPVAGRLPGHMNVLLADAGVPYDIVEEMDEINGDLPSTDIVLVIGANDIVNPSAMTDPNSPIAGMPVLTVWEAGLVVVLKRGMGSGYAGVQNPLFFHENTAMLFGDARASMEALHAVVRDQAA